MRLICPNCGAQYEVDEQVIPDAGRDVQCSNCGHTWFQRPAHADEELADELGQSLPETVAPSASHAPPHDSPDGTAAGPDLAAQMAEADSDWGDEDDEPEAPPPAPEPEPEPEGEAETPPRPEAEPTDAGEPAPEPQQRKLDQGVLSILREEAEREAAQRRGDSIETQGDLGLEEDLKTKRGLRERMARLRGLDDDDGIAASGAGAAAAGAARRDVFPDIEEINSTLRAEGDRDEDEILSDEGREPEERRRSGFRRGFSLILMLLILAGAVYAMSPQIVARFPASEGIMSSYVGFVNDFRDWLNAAMQSGAQKLTGLLGQITGD